MKMPTQQDLDLAQTWLEERHDEAEFVDDEEFLTAVQTAQTCVLGVLYGTLEISEAHYANETRRRAKTARTIAEKNGFAKKVCKRL